MCANLTWDAESTYRGHIYYKIFLLVLLTSQNSWMDYLKLTGQPSSAGLQLVHHFVLLFTCVSVFANKVCLGLLNKACVTITSIVWTSCQHFCLSILTPPSFFLSPPPFLSCLSFITPLFLYSLCLKGRASGMDVRCVGKCWRLSPTSQFSQSLWSCRRSTR